MKRSWWVAGVVAGSVAFAAPALAEDDLRAEVEALKSRLREQERRVREMEGRSIPQEEVSAALDRYVATGPIAPSLVGGADEKMGGKAGWPAGKRPFLREGANQLNVGLRCQTRYESFLYSDHAVGTLETPADTLSGREPRDRSAFEIERMVLTFDGSVFCEDLTYMFQWNFDSDSGRSVEKRFEYLDYRYSGDHHVRAGNDKTPFGLQENVSSGSLAFVDRTLASRAFSLGWDTGVSLWGTFGDCGCPKRFWYKAMVSNGEGNSGQVNVFSADAFDTAADTLLYSAALEWTITCEDWRWDEVDNRCDDRCRLDASVGVSAYYENDDDANLPAPGGLRVAGAGPLERTGLNAWVRAQYDGWSFGGEWFSRKVDFTAGSAAPDQEDWGYFAQLHYRFPCSRWGLGVRYSQVFADFDSVAVGAASVPVEDTYSEFGVVVNYFVWDHANKLSADVSWIQDNAGVSSSSTGHLVDPKKGVVVEDGVLLRVQWQITL